MGVKKGDKVKLHYSYKVEGEKEFDSSIGKEPAEFKVGRGEVIQGVEEALIGMEQGEKKEITVSPEKGFGEQKDNLVQKASKDILGGREVKKGEVVDVRTGDGRPVKARVASVDEDSVTLDLNHPLAGKTLKFEIEVVDIQR